MGSGRPRGRLNGVDIKPEVLRRARAGAGLSLAQVAGAELTRQAVHLIETGKVRPSMQSLRVITSRLAVPMQAVLVRPHSSADVRELETLIQGHHYDRVLERGQEILRHTEADPAVALVHFYLGSALCRLGRPQPALKELKLARELFESMGSEDLVAETMDLEARTLHNAEQPQALAVAEEALQRYRALEHRRSEIESRLVERVATILAGRGDFAAARVRYDEALEVAGGVRDLAHMARIYHGLGHCYLRVGDLGRAVDLVLKAETLYEAEQRINDAPPNVDLPVVENDLGTLLMEQGDLDRAEQRFQSALQRFAALGAERLRSYVLLSLGELRHRQRRYDQGLELVEEAVGLAHRLNATRALAAGYKQLGELRAAQGNLDRAISDFRRALAILEEAGLEERRAECMRAYERALAQSRQPDAATSA